MSMTYNEAINYIHSISWLGSRPGLERIGELCRALGDVQDTLRVIHVAGTNGKGSFCAMLSRVLMCAGYSVGMFTSPYVKCFNERIQLNGEPISNDELARFTSRVAPVADAMSDHPTEFELITAVGFSYFAEKRPDFVILEAGMGGRLDSTNIIKSPVLSVITGVALDHTAYLGDTVEKIAAEKAGIIKHGGKILLGACDDGASRVVQERAAQLTAEFYAVDYNKIGNCRYSIEGTDMEYDGEHYTLSLLGEYQTRNAAAVITAAKLLEHCGINIPHAALKRGLAESVWHARFEVLCREPLVLYDGAHNPDGIGAAVRNIELLLDKPPIAVIGVMADKAHSEMLSLLSRHLSCAVCVTPDNARALDCEALALELSHYGVESVPCAHVADGVRLALERARRDGLPVLILGSLYMYADAARAVETLVGEDCK